MSDKQLSRADFESLQHSLAELEARNQEIVEKMSEMTTRDLAASTSDAFFQLKREQGDVLQRIDYLHDKFNNAVVSVGEDDFSQVDVGNRVTAYSEQTKSVMIFDLVGTVETNSTANRVTADSPLGQALLGRERGDNIKVDTPEGTSEYRIVDILPVPETIS